MDPLYTELAQTLRRLIPAGSRVLVAVSGGPDSQALLHLLAAARQMLGCSLAAAGVDHGLRAAAGAELDLAEALAGQLEVPFVRRRVTVIAEGDGAMAAARRARHEALRQAAAAAGATLIALAHSATDQAETLLFRMSRGTALRGAGAMRPKNGPLIRPLLEVTRDQLLAYVRRQGLSWADDPSNTDPRWARPRLRHEVLPVLRELHGDADRRLARFCAEAREDDDYLGAQASAELERCTGPLGSLEADELAALPRPLSRRVVAAWLSSHGLRVSGRRVARLLAGAAVGHLAITLEDRRVRLEHGRLWAEPASACLAASLPLQGDLRWEALGLTLSAEARGGEKTALDVPGAVAFDRAGLHLGLWARPWRPGDRFRPFGLEGHIKVGDLFTNYKVPTVLRRHWPLIVHGDEVVWVVGLRRGALAPVTGATRDITRLQVHLDRGDTNQLFAAAPGGPC